MNRMERPSQIIMKVFYVNYATSRTNGLNVII